MGNYPKTRAPRNVSYSKSYKLLQAAGEEYLRDLFSRQGMYNSAKALQEELGLEYSPYVIRHCRSRYKLGGADEKDNL